MSAEHLDVQMSVRPAVEQRVFDDDHLSHLQKQMLQQNHRRGSNFRAN